MLLAGRMVGTTLHRHAIDRRRIAVANIARAFPRLSSESRRHLVRESFEHAGIGAMESVYALSGRPPATKQFSFHGAEHLEVALAQGRGAVLLQARFSCLDAAAFAISERWPMTAVSGLVGDARHVRFVRRRRARLLDGVVDNDDLRGMLDVLRRGKLLWLCPDVRVPKARSGFPLRYFGQSAMCSAAPAMLARTTGAALIPFVPLREGTRYRIRFEPALTLESRAKDTMQRINDLFEVQVRAAPEQYLWMNRRFEPGAPGERAPGSARPRRKV